jgi:hypothetical protein
MFTMYLGMATERLAGIIQCLQMTMIMLRSKMSKLQITMPHMTKALNWLGIPMRKQSLEKTLSLEVHREARK